MACGACRQSDEPGSDPRLLINIFRETPMGRKRRSFKEKQNWVMARLSEQWEREKRICKTTPYAPNISSSNEEDEEAWHAEFGGHRIYYMIGPHVSPDFSRTLREMWKNGILYRATAGNQEARTGGCSQKTYYVAYWMKSHHHEAIEIREKHNTKSDLGSSDEEEKPETRTTSNRTRRV